MKNFFRRLSAAVLGAAIVLVSSAVATPTISITSPTTGSTLNLTGTPPSTTITANTGIGSSPAGTQVSSVTFFANGTAIGTVGGGAFGVYSISWQPTATGTYNLTATVTDTSVPTTGTSPNLNTATSPLVIVTVTGFGPTVALTSPTAGSSWGLGSSVTVAATATPSGSSNVTRVDFLAGSTVIGTAVAPPYVVQWTPSTPGAVSLTARAVDDAGFTAVSTPVQVTVTGPSVSITSPLSGAGVTVGTVVPISASATAVPPATVAKVDFLAGNSLIGTATSAPYTVNWTPTTAGPINLTARVTDSNGAPATSNTVAVTVTSASVTPPTVSITSPTPGAIVTGGNPVSLTATATPSPGATITQVQFSSGGTVLGTATTAPYTVQWTPLQAGNVNITARVVDSSGASANSSALPLTVVGGQGSVSLSSHVAGAVIPTAGATLIATASPGVGNSITGVQFFANGTAIGPVDTSSPYQQVWVPTTSGTVTLEVRATESNGNTISTGPISVTVGDNALPSLTLSPNTNFTLPQGSSRSIVATATPGAGRAIASVEFFVDGASVAVRQTAPYTYRFTAPAAEGTSTILVRATDNGGLVAEKELQVTMVSAVGERPVVRLIGPAANTTVLPNTQLNLVATASDPDGTVANVQFFARGEPVGAADATSPYSVAFNPTLPGTYVLEAVATDDKGNTAVSEPVTLTAAFATPTINITSPSPAATARATPNVPLNIQVNALGGGGAGVLLVEFLLDGVPIGTVNTPTTANGSTYLFRFTPTAAQIGAHTIVARVTDNNSQTATSSTLNINVANAVGTAPTVSIAQPAPGGGNGQQGNLQSLSTVNFVANAAATTTGVNITGVEFFLNDVSIGTGTREQTTNLYRLVYDFSRFDFTAITPDANGRFIVPLYAIARDSNNNQTATNTVNLTINPSTSSPPSVQLQNVSGTNTITQGQQFLAGVISSDSDGAVSLIQLYANGSVVASASNPAQGQLLFYNANTAGRFNLYVVATDDTGNTSVTAPPIVLNVTAVSAPVTSLTRPTDDTTATSVGAPVFLEGTATNNDTTQVPTMQFVATAANGSRQVINGQRVGTSTTYRAVWTPNSPGTFTISTQASVGTTQGTSSNSRRVVVANVQGLAPTVSIQGGVPNTATTASTANFTANATDSDGSVVEVEFFLNRNSIGFATRDDLANTWRMTASFAGLQLGANEVVALARDSSGNVAASTTNSINITGATSLPPTVVIEPSTTNAAFNRQIQLRANARDNDSATGNVNSVQYFANGTNIGQPSTNASSRYQVNWTPTQSGTYNVWAVATDSTGNTRVADTVRITVRRNNPVVEDAAFILQTYQDIANTTNINPIVFDQLDAQLASGELSRSDIIVKPLTANENLAMVDLPGFQAPVQLLAAYYVLMGEWPTSANYTTLLNTARNSLSNAIGAILNSNEYFAKYGIIPTNTLLNNPASAIPAETFLARLHQNAGLPPPSPAERTRFASNPTANASLGIARGYNPAGLNTAIAEFITIRNASNTTLMNKARVAALYYQLIRPQVTVPVEQITARIDSLLQMSDLKAVVTSLIGDTLYRHRYVTITRHPTSLVVAQRSGVIFNVEADGAPPLSYQWLLNGAPVPGATNAILSLTNVDATRVGSYRVVVTSSVGTDSSDVATLTLSNTPSRLANISTRGVTSGGANVMIGGFVVRGANANQTRQMLIRVVGPRLGNAPFNMTGFLADPRLEVYRQGSTTPILSNDNWGSQAGGAAQVTAIQQATNRAGAFPLNNNSADAVVLATLPPGLYTVMAHPPANNPNTSGIVLIEAYDVSTGGAAGPRAANVSTRGMVGTGSNVMIAGFVVNGAVSRRILIRGAGPTLASLGVPGVLADPQLTLVNQDTGETIRTNDNWASGDDAAFIASAATAAGAFPFANGSRDAAMLLMVAPGTYTVQLSGVGNTTGVGIVEVYDFDP